MRDSAPTMASHEHLLAACVAMAVGGVSPYILTDVLSCPDIDWAAFVRDGIRHGVVLLAAHELASFGNPHVPDEIYRVLSRIAHGCARRNDAHFSEIARLTSALKQQGIHSLLLKGPALALTAYHDRSLRSFADIDLLVSEEEFAAACRVAASLGYVSARKEIEPLSHEETLILAYPDDILSDTLAPEYDPDHAPECVGPYCRRFVLEIHRGLFRDASGLWRETPQDAFWRNPQMLALPDGTICRTPSPEAMLVHLAGHAADHGFDRLLFLADVCMVVSHYKDTLDWTLAFQIAEEVGLQNDMARALEAAHRELDAPVPDEALCGFRGEPVTLARLFASCRDARSAGTLRRWLASRTWQEAVTAAWRLLAPPPATMRRVYGVSSPIMVALLYLYRPFQLTGRLATITTRKARRAIKSA